MKILLKNNSEYPIYEQIKQQIKENILKGYISPGDHLSSMRELAKDLRVSLITTKRAYEDLEKDGFVTTIRGKGTYVKEQDNAILKEKQFIVIEDLTKSLVKEAKTIGMPLEELNEILALIYEEENE
ncbi:GntR family transcriptional regulator [Staphylococcus simulans]|uniref:PSM export ABC transporter transcriptional regulator PmtR n=1 Tax=Staphylococcus simulans TaxID=1286 RepID=UPI0021CE407E|nr:GntR family transcriptional regulator [Staphylococcus simulans]UXR31229.1 GntR family transcriptional regulator [Staphylococcus simulans]